MAGLDTIRYIIEALRTKPEIDNSYYGTKDASGVLSYYKKPQKKPRSLADETRYGKYQKMTSDMGETPLSYEEYMKGD